MTPPSNEQADRFNAMLKRAAAVGMCAITNDERIERSPNHSALSSPPLYDPGTNTPAQLNSVALRNLFVPPPTQLFMRIGVEGSYSLPPPGKKADRTTLTVTLQMKPGSQFSQGTELTVDMLEDPSDVDVSGTGALTFAGIKGDGQTLMKDKADLLTFRNYPNEASNVHHPVSDADLDTMTTNLDAVIDHLLDVAPFSCDQS